MLLAIESQCRPYTQKHFLDLLLFRYFALSAFKYIIDELNSSKCRRLKLLIEPHVIVDYFISSND